MFGIKKMSFSIILQRHTYDDIHLIRSIVNRNSFSIQFSYTFSKGHLTQIKDSAHRILQHH